jgi:hypothetical protein
MTNAIYRCVPAKFPTLGLAGQLTSPRHPIIVRNVIEKFLGFTAARNCLVPAVRTRFDSTHSFMQFSD